MEAGGIFVSCADNKIPNGLMLPIAGQHIQSKRMAIQAEVSKPTQKRIWQQLVQAKINAQGQVLHDLHGDDLGIRKMATRVKSGDPDNLEAQAARKYWRPLFKNQKFKRDQEADGQNAQLNYGYGILRAVVARATVAAGLHPSLGIHHKNQYNAFCLVDDLMEPYRPIVDYAVAHYTTVQGKPKRVDKEFKAYIIKSLTKRQEIENEQRTLFDCAQKTANSIVNIYEDKQKNVTLPKLYA